VAPACAIGMAMTPSAPWRKMICPEGAYAGCAATVGRMGARAASLRELHVTPSVDEPECMVQLGCSKLKGQI
jgi:hypothetical protein